jgi:hypothetical protein
MATDMEMAQLLPQQLDNPTPGIIHDARTTPDHHDRAPSDLPEQPQSTIHSLSDPTPSVRPLPLTPRSSLPSPHEITNPYLLDASHLQPSSSLITLASERAAPAVIPLASPPPPQITTGTQILVLMIKHTAAWVFGGIGLMILGIGLAQGALLPRIRTCPMDAECPGSFDPNTTNALTLLQGLMQYWHKAGMVLATMGLLKLSAYQAWFIMMRDGNTMANLDLNLGAIRGSILDAARLIFRRGNRWMSAFVLSQLAVGAAITLVVTLSITRDTATQLLEFSYPSVVDFPDTSYSNTNTAGHIQAIAKTNAWALNNDTSHSSAHRGTLVFPDGRNISTNSRPGGPRIKGTILCHGIENHTVTTAHEYDLFVGKTKFTVTKDMRLAVSMVTPGKSSMQYIWASNSATRIPNATQTTDGVINMALCTHKLSFENDTQATNAAQEIEGSLPMAAGCTEEGDPCAAAAVHNAILGWWGGRGTSMWGVNCRGSVIGPLPRFGTPNEDNCALTDELWTETATSMLDALMQTAGTKKKTSQALIVPVETLSVRRWWLQGLIPLFTLVLYGIGLCYTARLSQGNTTLKKLTLVEVIEAAHTEHVRDLLDAGKLKRTTILYGSDTGFITPNHHVGSRATDDEA